MTSIVEMDLPCVCVCICARLHACVRICNLKLLDSQFSVCFYDRYVNVKEFFWLVLLNIQMQNMWNWTVQTDLSVPVPKTVLKTSRNKCREVSVVDCILVQRAKATYTLTDLRQPDQDSAKLVTCVLCMSVALQHDQVN